MDEMEIDCDRRRKERDNVPSHHTLTEEKQNIFVARFGVAASGRVGSDRTGSFVENVNRILYRLAGRPITFFI